MSVSFMRVLCGLFIASVFLVIPSSRSMSIKLFILAGQSNMVGYQSNIKELSDRLKQPQNNVFWYSRERQWVPLTPPTEPLPSTNWMPHQVGFGPEITLGRTIAEKLNDRVALVKYAVNGSNLAEDWNPENNASLYYKMRDRVSQAIATLEASGYLVDLAGFFWMQGEADASHENLAPHYEANLIQFIQKVRDDFNHQKLPFIYGMVHFGNNHSKPNGITNCCGKIVREAQMRVSKKVAFTRTVETEFLPLDRDLLHFNSQGLIQLGKLFAQTWIDLHPSHSR